MINFLFKFENRLTGLPDYLLLAIAVITIAAGIFALLGGLGLKKILFAVIGAYFGVAFSIFVSGPNLMLTAAIVGASVLLALKLQSGFLSLITSIFAAVYGFSALVLPYFSTRGELLDIIRSLAIGVPYYYWPILLALTALPFAASSSYWQATTSVLSSAAGAAMLIAATMILMVQGGIAAAGHISAKRELYLEVFAAVVILATLVQLLLLPRISSRLAVAKEAAKVKAKRARKTKTEDFVDGPAPKSTTWRTA